MHFFSKLGVFWAKIVNFALVNVNHFCFMSFSKFMRRAFGIDGADSGEEFQDIADAAPRHQAAAMTSAASGDVPAELVDALLSVINSQLPEGLAACIDTEAQRRWLVERLGSVLQTYGEQLNSFKSSETTKREEQKAALLSEQRQRRALTERNRDLEARIDELDSEIEQHKLTISSLTNKLRLAQLGTPATDDGGREAEKLKSRISELCGQVAERDARLMDAERQLADERDRNAQLEKEVTSLSSRVDDFESIAAAQKALESRGAAADDATTPSEPAPPKRRRGRPRKKSVPAPVADDSSIDLEEIDWLLPGGVPAGHVGHVSDPQFGYQPPKQAPEPDSDAQLTLF